MRKLNAEFKILIFFLILLIVSVLSLNIFRVEIIEYFIKHDFDILFSTQIYGISINFYTFLITIIFTLIGFSISRISKYNLSKFDYYQYLLFYGVIFIFVIVAIIMNIFFYLYNSIFPYNLISIISLVASIVLFLPLITYTIYCFDSENIFKLISNNIQKFIIKSNKQKTFKISDHYFDDLILKISLLFEHLISTIDKNDFIVCKRILEEIPTIVQVHLNETYKIQFKDDQRLVTSLTDNFDFVFSSLKNSYNEKLYDFLVVSIGNTSMAFLKNRERDVLNRSYEFHFHYLLFEFYKKSFILKRSSVCPIIIDIISKHILYHDEKYNISYNNFLSFLNMIEKFLFDILNTGHDFWASMNYRSIVGIKRKRFLNFLKQISELDYVFPDMNHIEIFFGDFAKGFIEVKKKSNSLMAIFPSMFGIDSLIVDIANLNLDKLEKKEQKINVNNYISELIQFYKNIILTDFEKNDSFVYNFYPEIIFLVLNRIDLLKEDKEKLVQNIFDIMLENIEKYYTQKSNESMHLLHYLKEHFLDSFALYLFSINYKKEKKHIVAKIIKKIIEVYEKCDTKYKSDFYPVMKLIGCWINYLIEIDNELIEEFNTSIAGFSDEKEEIFRRSTGTDFQTLNYYSSGLSYEGFFLSPSAFWNHPFQIEVSNYFNQDMEIYKNYHEKLEELRNEENKR